MRKGLQGSRAEGSSGLDSTANCGILGHRFKVARLRILWLVAFV